MSPADKPSPRDSAIAASCLESGRETGMAVPPGSVAPEGAAHRRTPNGFCVTTGLGRLVEEAEVLQDGRGRGRALVRDEGPVVVDGVAVVAGHPPRSEQL